MSRSAARRVRISIQGILTGMSVREHRVGTAADPGGDFFDPISLLADVADEEIATGRRCSRPTVSRMQTRPSRSTLLASRFGR
jgi:hypothetical protein